MECPYCSHSELKVTDKRDSPDGIRRRRECLKCKKRFTTYEKISRNDIYIIKKNGQREVFSQDKLSTGIYRAFEKRPISKEKIDKLISDIEESLRRKGKKEIKSGTVGEAVMKKLKKISTSAEQIFCPRFS